MNRRIYLYIMMGVLALALVLRLSYVLTETFPPIEWDQLEYTKMTIQWIEKGFYAYKSTEPNSLITPGMPAFLYIIYSIFGYDAQNPATMASLDAVRILNCFIALGAIWFIYKLGDRLFHPAAGVLAALLAAVNPSYVWSVSLILTEVPFLTLFMMLLFLQVRIIQENRKWDHVLAGLLLGLVVLIRPNILPLAVVPYVFLWVQGKKLYVREIMLGVGTFAVVMMPWWIRNILTFHHFILLGEGEAGNPFLGGTDPYGKRPINWDIPKQDEFKEGVRRIKKGFRTEPSLWIRWFTTGKFSYFFSRQWVGPYPFAVPKLYFEAMQKLQMLYAYLGWFILAVFSFRSRSFAFLSISLAIFYVIHAMFIPEPRYVYGMLPFLMLGFAQVVTSAIRYVFMKRRLAA